MGQVANSDISLGVDEDGNRFSWMTATPARLKYLDARLPNSFTHYSPLTWTVDIISDHGLWVPGYLWKVNQEIDLTELQTPRAKASWFQTRQSNFTFHALRIPSYTSQTWSRLLHSPVFNDLPEAKKEELRVVLEKGENIGSDEYDKWATDLRAHILKQMPENIEGHFRAATCVWLIRVLYTLRRKDELEVADAIWNSVRADNWNVELSLDVNKAKGTYNSVADFPAVESDGKIPIADHTLLDMFQLDRDNDGGFQQCWLIDSILRNGYVRVGKFVRISSDDEFAFHPEWFAAEGEGHLETSIDDLSSNVAVITLYDGQTGNHIEGEEWSKISEHSTYSATLSTGTAFVRGEPSTTDITTNGTQEPFNLSDHADVQPVKQLMMSNLLSLIDDVPLEHLMEQKPLNESGSNTAEKQKEFLFAQKDWDPKGLETLKSMRAVFDIDSSSDKQTWVLTPYD